MKVLNQKKLREKFIKSGVKMIGPETIFFSKDTKIGSNVTIEPYVVIGPNVKIGNKTCGKRKNYNLRFFGMFHIL